VAIDYARRLGADVITMSLGGEGFFQALRESIAAAVDEGVIVMAAGGNYWPSVVAPARFSECLAVAATGPTDKPWRWTSPGPQIDWAAPGEAVWVAVTRRSRGQETYDEAPHSGSSFAVAHSAAVAARWIAKHGRQELRQRYGPAGVQWAFRALARQTARPGSNWDEGSHGAGILNAEALLKAPLPPASAGRPPSSGPAVRGRGAAQRAASRLAPFVPEVPPAELPARLAELLGVPETRLGEALGRFGGELAHHLTEDRGLREQLNPPRRAGARAKGAAGARPTAARARLSAVASRGLREQLRGGS
jgi:hypothetical protein